MMKLDCCGRALMLLAVAGPQNPRSPWCCAGTIFGIYERLPGSTATAAALQPGTKLVASG